MSFWRPRSVLQLVLVGFFTALAPLCLAILFTVQTLEDLAAAGHALPRKIHSRIETGLASHRGQQGVGFFKGVRFNLTTIVP